MTLVTLRVGDTTAGRAAAFSGSHEGDELSLGTMRRRDDVLENCGYREFGTAFVTDNDALLEGPGRPPRRNCHQFR